MKANLTNLRKVLKACAKAHNTTFHDWAGECQLGLQSATPGTVCDVRMIAEAFFGRTDIIEVDTSWGWTIVWLEEFMWGNKSEVNMSLCAMALPYGTI